MRDSAKTITFVSAMALALAGVAPALAQTDTPSAAEGALTLEHRTALRCAAAFAITANLQQQGKAAADYPPLAERGREFFVRSAARVMDDTGLDRAGVANVLTAEAQELADADARAAIMPACLLLLDASGV
ncbi:hypothetical protein [Pseudopontixanthobacter vadosimaris]|uniref:hypothetical protein n=1 Tax=Pseudopontixanthobacter vadosimaris TaxID=2726450 RepID=UPI001F0D0B30|nr:hypothetical protein [Pseudopontixanthobacter vadosimaris]